MLDRREETPQGRSDREHPAIMATLMMIMMAKTPRQDNGEERNLEDVYRWTGEDRSPQRTVMVSVVAVFVLQQPADPLSAAATGDSPPQLSLFLLTAHSPIASYVPTAAQIMASRSAHTGERERGDGGRGCARGRGMEREREGEGGGCEEKPTACVAERKKEDIEKGKGGADKR
ncbi:hypothetical protein NQZ68_014823 [Dissostichus eleginoides]|nr:hypothetical protein NQZ68_014823 [Dissostichus eleginoides]